MSGVRAVLAVAAVCSAAAAIAQSTAPGGDKPPILVGAVSSLTGPGASAASVEAARAYFDAVNAAGGIQGRRIEYTVIDDQMNPEMAGKAAAQLVGDLRVVALAGGSSVLECGINHARYAQARIFNLPGAGVDPACFASTHILPMNAGPYVSTANALTFVRSVLQIPSICVVSPALPGMTEAFERAVGHWARRTGALAPALVTYRLEDVVADVVQQVAARRCQAVVYTGPEEPALEWVKASRTALAGVPLVLLTASYTSRTAVALGGTSQQLAVYAMAEFDPWSSSSLQIMDWRRLLLARQIEPSSLSQGGYIAARALVQVMSGIEGPITRASVTQALERMPLWSGMTGGALRVGAGGHHVLNRSAVPMRLVEGRWRVAHPDWISEGP